MLLATQYMAGHYAAHGARGSGLSPYSHHSSCLLLLYHLYFICDRRSLAHYAVAACTYFPLNISFSI